MSLRIAVSLCLLLFGLVVPWLEISPSHVLNPAWPAHARLHEAWQLATNCALAGWGLYALWRRGDLALACRLGLAVTGGFLLAWLLRDSYRGAMRSDNGLVADVAGGLDLAVLAMALATGVLAAALWRQQRRG